MAVLLSPGLLSTLVASSTGYLLGTVVVSRIQEGEAQRSKEEAMHAHLYYEHILHTRVILQCLELLLALLC